MKLRILVTLGLAVMLTWLAASGAVAQSGNATLSAETRAALTDLLGRTCGTGEEIRLFQTQAREVGQAAEPFLIIILRSGTPEEVLAQTRQSAADRYATRQSWLKQREAGEVPLLDEETMIRLSSESEQAYVARTVETLNLTYRENAVRALGVVGSDIAIPEIQRAVERHPALRGLSEESVEAIRSR